MLLIILLVALLTAACGRTETSETAVPVPSGASAVEQTATAKPAVASTEDVCLVYFTMQDRICTTRGENFEPILQIPAPGVHNLDLFASGPDVSAPEETHTPRPLEQGTPFSLSSAQQYAANLSLSNFSEQWFCEIGTFDHYDPADTSIAQLFSL